MPKLKPDTIWPTEEEDAALTAAALSDPDAQPLTDAEFKRLRPMRARLSEREMKMEITMRLDVDVIEAFRQMGDGWQARMNDALRDWLTTHPVG